MLNEREITLIRVALILRLDQLQRPDLYQEHKSLLAKLWELREALTDDDLTYDRSYEAGWRDAKRDL